MAKDDKQPTISLKLGDDLKNKAETMAKDDERSVSGLVRVLLKKEWDARQART